MGSNLPHKTFIDTQERYRSAMMQFFEDLNHTHAITLSWNEIGVSLERARSDLRELLWQVDKRILGSRADRYPSDKRTQAVFCFEGLGQFEQLHAHSTWRAPEGRWIELCRMFPNGKSGIWDTVVRKGSHKLVMASPNGRNAEINGYLLKQQHRNSDSFEIVFASEFHSSR